MEGTTSILSMASKVQVSFSSAFRGPEPLLQRGVYIPRVLSDTEGMDRAVVYRIAIALMIACAGLSAKPETGLASWYGAKFHGRQTASGELFDRTALTAAHRRLPFGTIVEVTNLRNGRSVTVRISDRGPYVEGRILDLSEAAAERLEMLESGVEEVSIRILQFSDNPGLEQRRVPAPGRVIVQISSHRELQNALRINERLRALGFAPELEKVSGGVVRVILPDIPEKELVALLARLKSNNFQEPLVRRTK